MSSITLSDDVLSEWPKGDLKSLPFPGRMTEEEFIEWIGRFEGVRADWLDGQVIPRSPVSVRHSRLFIWLCQILEPFVRVRGLGTILGEGVAIRLRSKGRKSRRYPDLMFVAQDRLHVIQENHLEGPPDLAVEIVSSESVDRDWDDKLKEYAGAGIREYWIIDPKTQRFETFQLSPQGTFVSFHDQPAGLFTSLVVTGFQIQVEWLWEEILPYPEDILKGLGIIN